MRTVLVTLRLITLLVAIGVGLLILTLMGGGGGGVLFGQTVVNGGRNFLGPVDLSNSPVTRTLRIISGSLPGSCTVGDLIYKSDATAGQNLYACTSTNTWTAQAGGGGGGAAVWGSITGTLSSQGDLNTALNARESLANKNAASGYAGLTAGTKLNLAQMQEVMGLADLTGVSGSSGAGTTVILGTISTPSTGHVLTWDGTNWINQAPGAASVNWGSIGGTLSSQADLNSALGARELSANKNAANGYAGLTAGTKLQTAQGQEVWGLADLTDVSGTSGNGTTALKVSLTGLSSGQWCCVWDGTSWANTSAPGGAPSTASYITKIAEAGLSNEFALGSLPTGLLKVTNATGDLSVAGAADLPAHATRHQNGGNDEIATATAGANAIPKAGGGGTLDSNWLPNSGVTGGTYGSGSQVPAITVDAKGRITGITTNAVTPGGAAGGDLGGTYPNPSVVSIRGSSVNSTPPAAGEALMWSTTNGNYTAGKAGWLNCKLYGAVGNGSNDDTAAIQSCINALPNNGGVVFLPRGRYRITSPLTVGDGSYVAHSTKHNIRIQGEGRGVNEGISGSSDSRGTTEIFYDGSTTYTSGTGTISATRNERYIYGVSTQFRTQLVVGGRILVGGIYRTVVGIYSDTEMYVDIPVAASFSGSSFTYLNAPMVRFMGPQLGTGLGGLRLNGAAKATAGIAVVHVSYGKFDDFFVDGYTGAGMIFTSSPVTANYFGCNSVVTHYEILSAGGGADPRYHGTGIVLDGQHVSGSDTCSNKFYWGQVTHGGGANSAGVVIGYADNNRFDHLQVAAQGFYAIYNGALKSYSSTDELEMWSSSSYSSTMGHGLTVGDLVRFNAASGSLPGGLSANTNYYVTEVTSNTRFKVGLKSPSLDTSTDTFTLSSHNLFNGQVVQFSGTAYGGMGTGGVSYYFVRDVTGTTFKVAHRQNGPAVDFFSTGSVSVAGWLDAATGATTVNITTDVGSGGNVIQLANVSGGPAVYFDKTKYESSFPKGNQFTEAFVNSMAGVSGTSGNSFLQIPVGEGIFPIMLENIYNVTERGAGSYGAAFAEYPHTAEGDVGFYVNNQNGGTNGASAIEWRRGGVPVASFNASLDYGAKIRVYQGGPLIDSVYFDLAGGVRLVGQTRTVVTSLTPANGTLMFCTDCQFDSSCTAGGTGAIAKRLNGAWRCD